jgi:hypothetical protein
MTTSEKPKMRQAGRNRVDMSGLAGFTGRERDSRETIKSPILEKKLEMNGTSWCKRARGREESEVMERAIPRNV